jgi:hypothetical protein
MAVVEAAEVLLLEVEVEVEDLSAQSPLEQGYWWQLALVYQSTQGYLSVRVLRLQRQWVRVCLSVRLQ